MTESFNTHKFDQASRDIPVLNVQVAIRIPIGPVGSTENAFYPFILGHIKASAGTPINVMTKDRNDRVSFVKNDDPSV